MKNFSLRSIFFAQEFDVPAKNRLVGEQPITKIIAEHKLKPSDIVNNSNEQLTYKMLSKAVKGKRLTSNIQHKVLNALNKATLEQYQIKDLFNY